MWLDQTDQLMQFGLRRRCTEADPKARLSAVQVVAMLSSTGEPPKVPIYLFVFACLGEGVCTRGMSTLDLVTVRLHVCRILVHILPVV